MDIDHGLDPNEHYRPIVEKFGTSFNDDDYMLDFLLIALAHAVPDRTFDIDIATIPALRMNDLRGLLKLGNYDGAAREVLRRCIAGEPLRCIALRSDHIWSIEKQKPAPSLPDTSGGRE